MSQTEELLSHMRKVQAAERDMRELGLVWQTIESSAAISCPEEVSTILPTLIRTRERFNSLQSRLIESLAMESRAELGDELSARAQCAIDILVRNLFERTADVGFLAMDDVIREFCAGDDAMRVEHMASMHQRLSEYRAKYTVYEDVILLAPDGAVLARLDTENTLARSSEPLIADALQGDGYRERFGPTDLVSGDLPALLYAHRISDADGRTLGVLVLHFRFFDEMARIFESMTDERGQIALMLIGDDQRVIASNDIAHVPLGALMPKVKSSDVVLTTFAGREYLAVTCATRGYQGYHGPSWRAQAMVSLLTAFRPRLDTDAETDVPLDNAQLAEIQRDADEINRELRRVVWNGQLMAQSRSGDRLRLKAVLNQVNVAGYRTRERVSMAVRDLYRTSLARARHQTRDLARLASDIMDRNLYERANDCRWWALSPSIVERLRDAYTDGSAGPLNRLLDRLNALYTVYSRIVIFDTEGRVRGVSRVETGGGLVGRTVANSWVERIRGLSGTQAYAVTDFDDTDFHAEGETYVYLAAVREPGVGIMPGTLVGGIAVIFNSKAEFGAMLRDVIGDRRGFAAFVDDTGRVVASTDPELQAGTALGFTGDVAVVENAGATFAVARARASGYREFKNGDGYDNRVSAVVGLRLGLVDRRRKTLAEEALLVSQARGREPIAELAVFAVGAGRYAITAELVMQSVSNRGLVRAPSALAHSVGMLEVQSEVGARLIQVLCARELFGVMYPSRVGDGVVLVLRSAVDPRLPAMGLRVDDVLSVLEVEQGRLQDAPAVVQGAEGMIRSVVDCELVAPEGKPPKRALVQLVDSHAMVAHALASLRRAPVALTTNLGTTA